MTETKNWYVCLNDFFFLWFLYNFINCLQSLPNPMEKQFILRVGGKTISKGTGGPQFLRAILGQNEFRLCGAFSQDTTFG